MNSDISTWSVPPGRPTVILKYAMSLDGKIACESGESQWITGPESRQEAHRLRNRVDAILVGSGTALFDNPSLTTRLEGVACRHPIRIVLDSRGRVPLNARLFSRELPGKTMVAASQHMPEHHQKALEEAGVRVLILPKEEQGLSLPHLMEALVKEGIHTLMVEGGAMVLGSFLRADIFDEVWTFMGGRLIGGSAAPSPFGGTGIQRLRETPRLDIFETLVLGSDILIKSRPRKP